jgi:predicted DCC family thiol-disulfide oxidoreductase YuxK
MGSMPEAEKVVLFDGVCNVCNSSVNFIIDRDRQARFRFASLQSEAGRRLCKEYGIPLELDSIALVDDGKAYIESAAVLRIAKELDGLWPALFSLVVLPKALRDRAYRYFASHRYRWFGRTEVCRVPTGDVLQRFLEE